MGTLGIVRTLLFHIQAETNPIYRLERRLDQPSSGIDLRNVGGCAVLFLLILSPTIALIAGSSSLFFTALVDVSIAALLILVGGLISLSWTVPLAVLVGQGIARERTVGTWDVLLTTPFPRDVILLVKGASSIRRVWSVIVTITLVATLIGIFFGGPVIGSMASEINDSSVIGFALMLFTMATIIIEHGQEIALAVVIGIVVALHSDSRRAMILLGLSSGLLIRLGQSLLTLALIPPHPKLDIVNLAVLNTVAGSTVILAAAPGLTALLFVVLLIVIREAVTRLLFAWAIQHIRGS